MHRNGYSYIEILVAVALLAVALPPALDTLGMQVRSATIGVREMLREYKLASRLDEVTSRSYADLEIAADNAGSKSTPTVFSDAAGTSDRVVVYLARYDFDDTDADGNPFTNPNDHLMWVRAEIEGTPLVLETMVTLQ